jgi:hypothetical protein
VIVTRYHDDSVSEGVAPSAAAAAASKTATPRSGGGGGGGGKNKKGLAKEIKNFKEQQVKNVLLEELLPGTTLIRDIKLKIQVRSESHHPPICVFIICDCTLARLTRRLTILVCPSR